MEKIEVIKFNGEREPFSFRKVYNSARRAGASEKLAEKIAKEIEKDAYSGIRTSEIFRKIESILLKENLKTAVRYNLKESLKKLGPTGFPFEKFVCKIFQEKGFKTKLNPWIKGRCCKYELDFLAEKKGKIYVGECKFRHLPDGRVHSSSALANYARFLDIKKGSWAKEKKIKSILITNNKFTGKAKKYSKCVGVDFLGWRYPRKENLSFFIEKEKLYPLTILPSLSSKAANIFAEQKILLAEEILNKKPESLSRKTGISLKVIKKIIKEAEALLNVSKS
jgi:hypothetical protein